MLGSVRGQSVSLRACHRQAQIALPVSVARRCGVGGYAECVANLFEGQFSPDFHDNDLALIGRECFKRTLELFLAFIIIARGNK